MNKIMIILISFVFFSINGLFSGENKIEKCIIEVSSTSNSIQYFQALLKSDNESESKRIFEEKTPFKIVLKSNSFTGVFHKIKGNGKIQVKMTRYIGDKPAGQVVGDWPLTLLVKENETMSVTGL